MATKLGNRAWMSTITAGTGTITLGSALSGYQSFAAAGVSDGETVRYTIIDGANWEIGTGVYTSSGTTLSRTPSESSNAGAAINLSGSASVFIAATPAEIVQKDVANTWTATQGYAESAITWVGSATSSWDCATKQVATLEASSGNTEMGAPTGVTAGRIYTLRFQQGATARTITWSSNFKFIGGVAPTLSTGSGDVDHFTFYGRSSNVLEEIGRAQDIA